MSGWGNLLDKFQPKPGEWTCQACLIDGNKAESTRCESCETPKPGSSQGLGFCSSGASTMPTGSFTFGAPPAGGAKPGGGGGVAPITFGFPAAATDAGKKRTREDGQVTKDEYYERENKQRNPPTPGLFKRAPPEILARRKMVVRGRRKEQELAKNARVLNDTFATWVHEQFGEGRTDHDWSEAVQDYLTHAADLEERFTGQSGQIMSFGSGDCGQLAHGEDVDAVKFPRVIRSLMKKGVCKIACGGLHNAAVTVNGELYTWGTNDEGALGRITGNKPGDAKEELPGRVDFESAFASSPGGWSDMIVGVVAGGSHTTALGCSGRVYTFGSFKDKEGKFFFVPPAYDPRNATAKSRIYDKKQTTPLLVQGLSGVVELACGENFDAARCADGTCYTWGVSECGEFGRPVPELKLPAGEDGRQPFDFDTIERECMTPRRVMVRTTDSNNAGQWTAADRMKDKDGVELVPADGVLAVGCGVYHMFVVLGPTSKSTVFACGLNNYGQLGFGEIADKDRMVSTLKHVKGFDTKSIIKVDGGMHHSLALSADGRVYSFGRGDSGQLGIGDAKEAEPCPTDVHIDDPVASVNCGSNHSMAVTRGGDVYTWGFGDLLALGNGKEKDETRPHKIDLARSKDLVGPQGVKHRIVAAHGGGQHSVILSLPPK